MDTQTIPEVKTGSLRRLPAVDELIRSSVDRYKERFWFLAGINAIPLSLLLVAKFLNGGVSSAIAILSGIMLFITSLALVYAVLDKEERSTWSVYKKGLSNFFPYLWLRIVTNFVILGGLAMLIVPGVIFATWFMLANFVFATKEQKGLGALLKSKQYVEGYWWAIFGRSLAIGLILAVFGGIVNGIIGLFGSTDLEFIAGTVFQIFTTPITVLYFLEIYRALQERKPEVASGETPLPKKGFWIFSGILGLVAMITVIFLVWFAITKFVRENPDKLERFFNTFQQIQQREPLPSINDTIPNSIRVD